jgi:hypothetical protein
MIHSIGSEIQRHALRGEISSRISLLLALCMLTSTRASCQTLHLTTLDKPPTSLTQGERITLSNADDDMAPALRRQGDYVCDEGLPTVLGPKQFYTDGFGADRLLRCLSWDGGMSVGGDFLFVDTTGTRRVLAAGKSLVGGRLRFDSVAASLTRRLGTPRRCAGSPMIAPLDQVVSDLRQWIRPGVTTQLRLLQRTVSDSSGSTVEIQVVRTELACGLWVWAAKAM